MSYTPWIVSEHVPDFSSLARLVSSPRLAGKKGQDLAIALWGLMVDAELGIFHFFPPQESLWGKDVVDPMKIFNVYGYSICHCHAHCLAMLFRAAGLPARIANITGHEGTEAFYDNAWHYFDADIQMFYRLRPPRQDVVASREDLYRDPSLVADQPHASPPHHMPDRLPAGMRHNYESPPEYPDLLEEQVHSMDFRLRPGEQMVRYFHNRGRWVVFNNYPDSFRRYSSETGPEGPTERFWPRRQWGNGYFLYQPNLTDKSRDAQLGADEMIDLEPSPAGLVCQGGSGHVVLAFESPYIFCGVPDPYRRLPAMDGAVLHAGFVLPEGTQARIELAHEQTRDWRVLAEFAGLAEGDVAKELKCKLDFTEQAEGRYRLRLRIVLEGAGATLTSLATQLWFMVSPHSLPALKNVGANRMSLHSGDEHDLPTRPITIEARMDKPDGLAGAHKTVNLRHDPSTYSLLLPIDRARPWELIYQLSAPPGGTMAWLRAYTLVEARRPEDKSDGVPAKIDIADSPEGPWRTIAQRDILEHPQGWHFGMFGQGRFGGASRNGYIRLSATKGVKGIRIMGHYIPANAQASQSPLDIEHVWYEVEPQVGRRLHTHVEKVTTADHQYVVTCRHQPHDERIVLRVPSSRR
jgi:hypothetical protein